MLVLLHDQPHILQPFPHEAFKVVDILCHNRGTVLWLKDEGVVDGEALQNGLVAAYHGPICVACQEAQPIAIKEVLKCKHDMRVQRP